MREIAPGVWKFRFGEPEKFTPTQCREERPLTDAIARLPRATGAPFAPADIRCDIRLRGCTLRLPMQPEEQIFGFGLNLKVLNSTGTRKTIRVSDTGNSDLGDSHAPAPFYVSSRGYGVFVDTARYATFYCDSVAPVPESGAAKAKTSSKRNTAQATDAMIVDVPAAQGVDVYVFGGPTMKEAVQRYNLFAGGGCLPPLWGLGVWYRGHLDLKADDVLRLAGDFRARHMPCDVFGLEPGWHTHAYSCSYVWNKERFPDPDDFVAKMRAMDYRLNLWEHAFVHPTSPIYQKLKPYAGDYLVWGGLVPDFATPQGRRIFGGYHEANLVKRGIAGFKLDECDNQPLSATPYSFSEMSAFPSGMDGEQMHSLIGPLYQRVINGAFRRNNLRTYSQVRASHALAASLPFVLYSDDYDHRSFVRGVVTSGFAGVLWQPEVRDTGSIEDLYRRMQTAVFSPQTLINAWFLKHPPWQQIDRDKNNSGELMPNRDEVEQTCRRLFELRMSLIPYLYSAFSEYHLTGAPPFRALVMDYPDDRETYKLDDEYLMGDSLLIAPLFAGDSKRAVYLPKGVWFDFWTGRQYQGGQKHEIEKGLDQIPVFVKDGSLVPLAAPVESVGPDTCFEVTVHVFGERCRDFVLYEDDGVSYDYERGAQNRVQLSWTPARGGRVRSSGAYKGTRYRIVDWKRAGGG